jgi:hypothetical protein
MGWKKGPLPPDTYHWGGVVPICYACRGTGFTVYTQNKCPDCKGAGCLSGFYFADFEGDRVVVSPGTERERVLNPESVAWYNNSLDLPPTGAKVRTPDRE